MLASACVNEQPNSLKGVTETFDSTTDSFLIELTLFVHILYQPDFLIVQVYSETDI